ncbi:hypothetical protein MF672_023735 [Actinomadura sp. ATCC 31491]|uniref:Uncharacterized protein n=1 Tax=Actinomadura luzonensis TaxID=2805427 RepID=A0ABT0FWS4_9ACTN|nr:hypothetical protein [Actinomadura luzonensis]MCK2216787.1 hypothetical protein [Actinomadura luzonensis]
MSHGQHLRAIPDHAYSGLSSHQRTPPPITKAPDPQPELEPAPAPARDCGGLVDLDVNVGGLVGVEVCLLRR